MSVCGKDCEANRRTLSPAELRQCCSSVLQKASVFVCFKTGSSTQLITVGQGASLVISFTHLTCSELLLSMTAVSLFHFLLETFHLQQLFFCSSHLCVCGVFCLCAFFPFYHLTTHTHTHTHPHPRLSSSNWHLISHLANAPLLCLAFFLFPEQAWHWNRTFPWSRSA